MSRPNLKLADEPPVRTAEREQLAAAIERYEEARQRLADVKTAQERALDNVLALKDAVNAAGTALEQAKANEPRQLVEAFIGGDTMTAVSQVKAAVAALEDAEARLAEAKQMRGALDVEEKAAERELEWAEIKRDAAVREAVRASLATAQLVEKFTEAERNYIALKQAMGVVGTSQLPDEAKFWNSIHRWPEMSHAPQWRAAIAALSSDADAELPTG